MRCGNLQNMIQVRSPSARSVTDLFLQAAIYYIEWLMSVGSIPTPCIRTWVAYRRSQGVQVWVHVHPQGGEENLGPTLQGKVISALPPGKVHPPPRGRAKVHFFTKLERSGGCERLFRYLACFEVKLFGEEKCTPPQTKSWLRLCWVGLGYTCSKWTYISDAFRLKSNDCRSTQGHRLYRRLSTLVN